MRGGLQLHVGAAIGFEGFGFAGRGNPAQFYISRYSARGGLEWIEASVCGLRGKDVLHRSARGPGEAFARNGGNSGGAFVWEPSSSQRTGRHRGGNGNS